MKDTNSTFTSKVLVAGAILVVIFTALVLHLVSIEQLDIATYKKLVASSQAIDVLPEESAFTATQKRTHVKKTIVFSEPDGRRMMRLVSAESELILTFAGSKSELHEKLGDVTCHMQEELYFTLPDGKEARRKANGRLLRRQGDPDDEESWVDRDTKGVKPMQRVRRINANNATYFYKKDLFAAEHVTMKRFDAPTHSLLDSWDNVATTMEGLARTVQFSVIGSEPSFRAQHLRVTMKGGESLL